MLVFEDQIETLAPSIALDASTGLPLLSEQRQILRHLTTYLPLPYSVGEYGCGKRASLIIERLLEIDIPPHAIARGLAIERDMSPAAVAERNPTHRPHALMVDNPLWTMTDLSDQHLLEMLEEAGIHVHDGRIEAGEFHLHHAERVQFVNSRSHVYPMLYCWDEEAGRAMKHVIDPTLSRDSMFQLEGMRELLHAPEALIFTAPLLGHFRLDEAQLTEAQRQQVDAFLGPERYLDNLGEAEHAELVRDLCGAAPGSIGDPETWTYANNMPGGQPEHDEAQRRDTGRGDAFAGRLFELLAAREARQGEIHQTRAALRQLTEESNVRRIVETDARWSTEQLEPLANLAVTVVYYNAIKALAETITAGTSLVECLETPNRLADVHGIGVRLRRRIDRLAQVSEDEEGRIDARALDPRFVTVTLEAIRQMNGAGLTVCVDKVGSIHGLLLDPDSREALREGRTTIAALLEHAIAFCSHLDTVKDAGRFDGRLGVVSGIETAQVIHDLERWFGVDCIGSDPSVRIVVSAFIGEEMTFTGRGVSMPGSAAVSGRAEVADVHEMKNHRGERFGDRLVDMLHEIARRQRRGEIETANVFEGDDPAALLDACFDPTDFFTPHTYERHIEQGPVLDRLGIPVALVGTIMGIHQEDFTFAGELAESAALDMNLRLRQLANTAEFPHVRITVGILAPEGEAVLYDRDLVALRWTLVGEKNHAGATATPDRRDPGVAAARLARAIDAWLTDHEAIRARGLRSLVGNVNLFPGTNRNVIPEQASFTLALVGAPVDALEREDLEQSLTGFAIGTLAKSVPIGGEGMHICRVEPISYATIARRARLSIDLRASNQETIDRFRAGIDEIVASLEASHGVSVTSEIQQQLAPYALDRSGQVLLLERSYGGSHNANETEMAVDITRSTVLQLAVAVDMLGRDGLPVDFSLFHTVERCIPARWRHVLDRYVSGALHDTCNIAACPRVPLVG